MFELFPNFICANNIGSLVNSLFGVKIFNPVPVILLFQGFNFILSAIVSSGFNFTCSLPSSGGTDGKSSLSSLNINQHVNFKVYFELLSFSC